MTIPPDAEMSDDQGRAAGAALSAMQRDLDDLLDLARRKERGVDLAADGMFRRIKDGAFPVIVANFKSAPHGALMALGEAIDALLAWRWKHMSEPFDVHLVEKIDEELEPIRVALGQWSADHPDLR